MDEKKPRTPRELAPGAAIAKLQALGKLETYAENRAEEAARQARNDAIKEYDRDVARILGRVHPLARDGVIRASGVNLPECFELAKKGDDSDVPAMTAAEIDEATAALPPGAREYQPGPAARAARGAR